MSFASRLDDYMAAIPCTAVELAQVSGLSAATVGRYRKGERVPSADGAPLEKLIAGLQTLIESKSAALSGDEIRQTLTAALRGGVTVDAAAYRRNLNALTDALEISNSELAKGLNYDPSYISRILSGHRRPADPVRFTAEVASLIGRHYVSPRRVAAIAALIGIDRDALADEDARVAAIAEWLGTNRHDLPEQPLDSFLEKLDRFDLNEFIRAIRFDEIKVPTMPFQFPSSRRYAGLEEMMASELDFLKMTVLSRSREDVIMYSDMPLDEMAKDPTFPKKWMFGMATLLKKGLRLQMIHDVNRPFSEMLLGLESYIPMYMTGLITPYYLDRSQGDVFTHLLKVSGAAALTGEAIAGHQAEGRYYLTNNKEELIYYRRLATRLLENARPLMQIFDANRMEEFEAQRLQWDAPEGDRQWIGSTPPLFTLSADLLERMTAKAQTTADAAAIRAYAAKRRQTVETWLRSGRLTLEVPELSPEEFDAHPPALALAGIFYHDAPRYTYEEYREHLELTRAFADAHPEATMRTDPHPAFRNIEITVFPGRFALVSKSQSPIIHFLIRHPRMVRAFENMAIPLWDEKRLDKSR